jgi:glycosyltransferase involved in cell wall biosynthesis
VATRVGGNGEVVSDGEDGLLVELGNAPALTNAIAKVVSDTELRGRLRENALRSAKRFSPDAVLDRTAAFLKNV